jgi:hypothetical protein
VFKSTGMKGRWRAVLCGPVIVLAVSALGLNALGADSTFYQRLQAAEEAEESRMLVCDLTSSRGDSGDGYIHDTSLVDTNNSRPILTNAPVSYAGFTSRGELAGIKLGMTMSEVVGVWGKPKRLGPTFHYGTGKWGDLCLWFSGDRLVWIGITDAQAAHVTFDNGLTSLMGRAESEGLLGEPALRDIWPAASRDISAAGLPLTLPAALIRTNIQYWRSIGKYVYRAGKLRTDIGFGRALTPGLSGPTERLLWISVCLEREVQPFFEQGGANGRQPISAGTNPVPAAAASHRSP